MDKKPKKPYQKPEIIHETQLEVRAGTVIPPGPADDPLLPDLMEDQP